MILQQEYFKANNILTEEEIQKIIDIGESSNLKEGEVSIVYQDEDRVNPIKFKILSVSDRYDEHVADFSKDYLKIQKLALQNKQLKEIN